MISFRPLPYMALQLLTVVAFLLCTSIATTGATHSHQQPSPAASYGIHLTPHEQQWLDKHPVIRVGHSSAFEPMMIQDVAGTIKGSIPDLYAQVGHRLGVGITFIDDDWNKVIQQAQNGKIDIIGQMNKTVAEHKGLLTTPAPFANLFTVFSKKSSNIIINNDADLTNLRIAYHKDILWADKYFEAHKENMQLFKAASPLEAFKLVLADKADVMVGFNANSYLLSKYFIPEIEPIYVLTDLNTVSSAAIQPNAPLLVSILQKTFDSFTQTELRNIISKWSWLPAPLKNGLDLTQSERHFLQKKRYLTVASLIDFVPFNFLENGQPTGYSIEYMQLIGDLLHIDIRFVSDSWMNLLAQLKKGKLDIVPHIAYTAERETFVSYTNFNHITYNSGFAVRSTEHTTSLRELGGKTVAVIENGFLHDYVKNFYPEIALILVKTSNKAIELVAQDKAFAALGSLPYLNYYIQKEWHTNLKTIAINEVGELGKTQMPMGVSKDQDILISILEKANAALSAQDITKLKQKWISGYLKENKDFSFTTAEKHFKEQHPIIRFRINSNRPPFEFINNGKASGIAVDYLQAISQKIGIKAEFVTDDRPYQEAVEVINGNRHEFDTLSFTVKSTARTEKLSFGDTYLSYPMMIIGHKNSPYIGQMSDLRFKKIAIEKGYLTNKWLKKDYPEIDIVPAVSTQDALQMVNDEKVDAYVGNLAIANYMTNHGKMENLKIIAPSDYGRVKFNFVAPKEWPELASLLSKGYRALTAQEQNLLNQRWFSVQVVEKNNYTLMWKILLIVGFFLFLILWWNYTIRAQKRKTDRANLQLHEAQLQLKVKNDELEILSQTDKLTSLYNRVKIDEVLLTEFERCHRYKSSFGLIMIDIDHFKQVNDTFGHQIGDSVLVEIATILIQNSRTTDTVGRWGGEEFLIICPHTEKDGLMALAASLQEKIAHTHLPVVGYKTASFGVTIYQDDSSLESILTRADAALYQSKENGRNQVTFV